MRKTFYQEHYFLNQEQYENLKEQLADFGGGSQYVMFPDKEGIFRDVGIEYRGIAYINRDNPVKQL